MPIDYFISNGSYFRYSNQDGSITFAEFKSRDKEMMLRRFNSAKLINPQIDTSIFRLFNKNPVAFWRWKDYIFDDRYKFPFKSWRKIKTERGYELKESNNLQDF